MPNGMFAVPALMDLKNAWNGNNVLKSWMNSSVCGNWKRLTCDGGNLVIEMWAQSIFNRLWPSFHDPWGYHTLAHVLKYRESEKWNVTYCGQSRNIQCMNVIDRIYRAYGNECEMCTFIYICTGMHVSIFVFVCLCIGVCVCVCMFYLILTSWV